MTAPGDMGDDVRQRFGARAQRYVDSETHASGEDLETLVAWADPRPGEVAVDVATGGGHVALALARRGARVIALDLTPEMLEVARKHLEAEGAVAEYIVGHAGALPFEDASVDLVTCRIAAHHFRDPGAFFREAARVLRPGGRLAFQDQALPAATTSACILDEFERVRDPSHRRSYSVDAWTALAERAGLAVERTALFEKRHDFAEWCERQSCSDLAVAELEEIASTAPPQARDWMAAEWSGERPPRLLAFSNRHVVLLARKP
jgi:ubiquinone/menaquinone biosynthesis C-methylase UbiE